MAASGGQESINFSRTRQSRTSGHQLKLLIVIVVLSLSASIRSEDSLLEKARLKFVALPEALPTLTNNPITAEKVHLGKLLFFEPRLSASWTISCNSCHDLGLAGVDQRETSIGHGWQNGGRNSPTVYNSVLNASQFWDGRARDLKEQAQAPIQAALEMNNNPRRLVMTLQSIPGYVAMFRSAFPNESDPISFSNITKAIEAFEATLLTPGSRFDKYLLGDENVLTAQEKRGLALFISRDCASCHKGINLGGQSYHRFGVGRSPGPELRPPGDTGRQSVTGLAADEYVYRAPSLRNVELTAPYFHTGKIWDLKEAVQTMARIQLDVRLKEKDADDLVAFLKTLTGVFPKFDYPILPDHSSETPLPDTRIRGNGN